METIKIRGARVHNLKNIDLELPKNKIIVFSGVSGSGKSSLAFDTLFAEGQRRYIESLSPYARQFLGQMKRADVDEISGLSPSIAIDQKALSHNPRSTVGTLTEIYDYLRILFARLGDVFCPECGGKIEKLTVDEMVDIILTQAKKNKTKLVTIFSPVVCGRKGEYYQMFYDYLNLGFSEARIDGKLRSLRERLVLSRYKKHNIELMIDRVMVFDEGRLSEAVESALNFSNGLAQAIFYENLDNQKEILLSSKWTCPKDNFSFPEIEPRLFSFNSPSGACPICSGLGKTDLFLKTICPDCGGKRLKPEALAVRINGKNIDEITAMPLDKCYEFFNKYFGKLNTRQKEIAENVIREITDRLNFLNEVGLSYLTLNREAETLSGGEAQRIRLSSQIGSHLSNTLYVLDEPTIGLHERDTDKLIKTLKSLRDKDNTVVIVEHDERTIMESDYIVDLGPMAGVHGGEVIVAGETKELVKKYISVIPVKTGIYSMDFCFHGNDKAGKPENDKNTSLTLQYLTGQKKVTLPRDRRTKITEKLNIIGARANNLKNLTVPIPLRKFICITGVSGSGKSSLLYDSLYKNINKIKGHFGEQLENVSKISGTEYIDRIVVVNQSPIGRTPRSNPATYTGILTPIRQFFASLPESQEKGYTLSRFSFNTGGGKDVAGGRCESCQGVGYNLIEMHFLPPVYVECEVCHGKRFNRETLQVKYKGKNISDVLEMTINESAEFFANIHQIADKLKVLQEVGLGYLKLGQSATTLSGGEAQRIKLARELAQSLYNLGKKTLYLLDEPTVGLHYYDIELLLQVLNKLIEKQNSVVVIEHNMHIIKSADYVIDLGPDGGEKGGKVVAKGTPEEIACSTKSITGKYLKECL